jgi:hypothetical protein
LGARDCKMRRGLVTREYAFQHEFEDEEGKVIMDDNDIVTVSSRPKK